MLRIDSLKHWRVLEHLWYDDETHPTATDEHVIQMRHLTILHKRTPTDDGLCPYTWSNERELSL